jgi:hypothetical protein
MHRRLESSINQLRQVQKDLRKELLGRDTKTDPDEPWDLDAYLKDPQTSWRIDCLCSWREALYVQNPHSRDYCDWLKPFVVHTAFQGRSCVEFWMNDVLEDNVRRNRITALVAYYQLHRKITHGNPFDQNHASNLLDVDYFFTCDRAFYEALSDARSHFTNAGEPVFLVREYDSVVEQLRAIFGARAPQRNTSP